MITITQMQNLPAYKALSAVDHEQILAWLDGKLDPKALPPRAAQFIKRVCSMYGYIVPDKTEKRKLIHIHIL